jgi:hypothetical protein
LRKIKFLLATIWAYFIIAADDDSAKVKRVTNFSMAFFAVGPITIFIQILFDWYLTNESFVQGNVFLIGLNGVLGGWFHFRKGDFSWEEILMKTVKMSILSLIVYAVLEIIMSRGGDYGVVKGFRAAIQIGTLLYPGTKILKNVYILSNGEYPPTWIMKKVYNFQENGDLNEFLGTAPPTNISSEMEKDYKQKFKKDE